MKNFQVFVWVYLAQFRVAGDIRDAISKRGEGGVDRLSPPSLLLVRPHLRQTGRQCRGCIRIIHCIRRIIMITFNVILLMKWNLPQVCSFCLLVSDQLRRQRRILTPVKNNVRSNQTELNRNTSNCDCDFVTCG